MPESNAANQAQAREIDIVCREARVEPVAQEGAELASTIRLIWTTGARVRRFDWMRERYYDEELSIEPGHIRLDRLNSGNAPLVNSHNTWSLEAVLGVVRAGSVRKVKDDWELDADLYDGPEIEGIRRRLAQKIIRNVSVGYRVYRYDVIEEPGKIPVYRAVDWEPVEVSLVAVPADAGAHLRSAADAQQTRSNLCHFVNHHRKEEAMPTQDTDKTETPEAKAAKAAATRSQEHEPTPEPTAPGKDEAAIRAAEKAGIEKENERVRTVFEIAATPGLPADFARKHIDAKTTVDEVRKAALDHLAKKQEKEQGSIRSHISFGEDEHDKFMRGASDWLLAKANVARLVTEHTKDKVEPGEFRGMSLLDLARETLGRSGVNHRGMDKMTLVGTALTHRSAITQSTSDFAVLLENTLHKVLLAAYATTPDTWMKFCTQGSVSDFRPHNRYRLGSFSRLDRVYENGEFKNKAIPDATKETITAVTKGNIINLSRQEIINDDMGAFNRLATMFGRAAKLSIEMDVYDLLAENSGLGPTMSDGNPLFDAAHDNISTGAALSAAAIDADRVTMGSQTDPSGNEILDLRPAVLLVPLSLGSTARTINDAQYDPDTANKLQKPNAVRGLFRDVVDTARLTGTRRYLFADPAIAPTVEVAFLDGATEPFLDSQEGWRVDGMEWKVRLDYGVDGVDWRGAVTNAGA